MNIESASDSPTPEQRRRDGLPPYEPSYDEAALDRFAEAGRKAWAGIDGEAWLRELRGDAI